MHALRDSGGVHEVAEAQDTHKVGVELCQVQGNPCRATWLYFVPGGGIWSRGTKETYPLAIPPAIGHPRGVHVSCVKGRGARPGEDKGFAVSIPNKIPKLLI